MNWGHLKEAKMGYLSHLVFAWRFGLRCLIAGAAALVHGVFPFAMSNTSSEMIKNMNDELEKELGERES